MTQMQKLLLGALAVIFVAIALYKYSENYQQNHSSSPTQVNPTISQDSPSALPTKTTTLANPASVNCEKEGGTLVIKKNGSGGEYGLCEFEDNMACEEWALMRGECPVGGIKTTGYDNIQQMYCAWVGGKTLAVPNASCTLPSGKACGVDELYNGKCP